jgi:hydrogenase maturation protease
MKKSEVRGPKSEARTNKSPRPEVLSPRSKSKNTPNLPLRISDAGPRTVVIAYGNPLRSDDGFGWHASRLLAPMLSGQDVEVVTCHQLTPELAAALSRSRRAVFIDADAEGKPGEIHRRAIRRQDRASSTFTHTCTPSGLLASAKQLYGRCPQAVVFTVSAKSFAFGESPSPVVSAALPKVVDQICQWVGASCATPMS